MRAAVLMLLTLVACDRRASAPRLELFTITRGDTCLVEFECAAGQACPAAYEYDCSYSMRPDGFGFAEPVPFARIGKTCYVREHGCATASCLTRTWSCPPPRPKTPLPTRRWTVERTGAGCLATPEARGRAAAPAAFAVPCVPAYRHGPNDVTRDVASGDCVIPDEPCPEGARCEPGEDTPVPCPVP